MRIQNRTVIAVSIIVGSVAAGEALANPEKLQIGLRGNALFGEGTPSNDVLGYGIIGGYKLDPNWTIAGAVDFADFDFERPWQLINVTQQSGTKAIDSKSSSTTGALWLQRDYELPGDWSWNWSVGGGLSKINVDDATGPVEGGGAFNITTNVDTEYLLLGGVGVNYRMSQNWGVRADARIEKRFAKWNVTDTVSGATGTVGDYTLMGVSVGVLYDF